MARVPNATQPQINAKATSTPYSRVDANAAAFGALTGQAMGNLGNATAELGETGAKIINDINKENLQRNARYLFNSYSEAQRAALRGDGTEANPGLLNLKGQEAIDALPKFIEHMSKTRAQLMYTADNDIVKDMFDQAAQERDNTALDAATAYVSSQRVAANLAASKVTSWNAINDGAVGWRDPQNVMQNLMIYENEAEARGKMEGLSGEALQGAVKQARAEYYDKVITQAAEENPTMARQMFNKYRAEIGGIYGPVLENKLDAADNQVLVRREREASLAHTNFVRYQEANDGAFTSRALNGQLTLQQIADAAAKQQISGSTARTLEALITKEPTEGPGSRKVYLDFFNRVYDGTVDRQTILDNTELNTKQKQELVKLGNDIYTGGGPLARADVKMALDDIRLSLVGEPGIGGYKADEGARLAAARTRFVEEINMLTNPEITFDKLTEIKKGIISNLQTNPNSPIKGLASLPAPKFFSGSVVGTKDDLKKRSIAGIQSLEAAYAAGTVDVTTYTQESDKLQKYIEQIDRMP